ncbi:unnamed protein product [Closterium sp. NIES-54]
MLLSKFTGPKSRRHASERNAQNERKDETECGSELSPGRQPAARVVVFERCGSHEALTARKGAGNPPILSASEPAADGDCGACGGCGGCGGGGGCGGCGGHGKPSDYDISTFAPAGFAHRLSFSMDEATLSDVARRACESSRESSSHRSPDASARRSSFSFNPPPLVPGEGEASVSETCEVVFSTGEIGEDDSATTQQQQEEEQEDAERCRCEKWMAFQQSMAEAEAADGDATAAPATTTNTFEALPNAAADISDGDCSAATSFCGLQAPSPTNAAAAAEAAEAEAEASAVAVSVAPPVAPSCAAATETLFSRRMKSQSHPAPRVVPVLGDTTTGTRNFPFPLSRGPESAGASQNSPLRNFPVPRNSSHNDRFPPPGAAVTAAFPPEPWVTCGSSSYQYTPPRVASQPFQSCTASESPRVTVTSMVTEIAYEPLPEGLFTPISPPASATSASSTANLVHPVSPWHDLPLRFDSNDGTVPATLSAGDCIEMVCTTPKGSWLQLEVAVSELYQPLRLHESNGAPAHYQDNVQWNLGIIPQTCSCFSEDDENNGRGPDLSKQHGPVEIIDIGSAPADVGYAYRVKPMTAFLVISPNLKTTLKIVGINSMDPVADKLSCLDDLQRHVGGKLAEISEWLKTSACVSRYDVPNTIGYREKPVPTDRTLSLLSKAHAAWHTYHSTHHSPHSASAASASAPNRPPSAVHARDLRKLVESTAGGSLDDPSATGACVPFSKREGAGGAEAGGGGGAVTGTGAGMGTGAGTEAGSAHPVAAKAGPADDLRRKLLARIRFRDGYGQSASRVSFWDGEP